jgi:endonuclease I
LKSRRLILAIGFLLSAIALFAGPPAGYYATAEGLSGAPLRAALHNIVRGHTVLPYSSSSFDTADALMVLDEDPANTNNVILVYERRSEPKSTFGLNTGWNREHLWPNSYGLDDREPAYSDLHNLRADDLTVNNARANKLFDMSDTNSAGYLRPGHPEAPLTSTDSDSWEPPDVVKGDIARAMFYMVIRYTGDRSGEPALFLTDRSNELSGTTNLMGRLSTLLRWHFFDPVSDAERHRNDLIYERYQRNRNPFVDRPEFLLPAFAPQLALSRTPTAWRLEWPGPYTGVKIEFTPALGQAWATKTATFTLGSTNNSALITSAEAQLYLRLRVE